jgi:simple sugar transport system permease protein
VSKPVLPSASLPRLFAWYDDRMRLTAGIFVALAAAWFVYWLLFRSTYGFEFRAVGYNADAARYAGMRVPRATVVVMALAGALAGLAGGNQVLGVLGRATPGFSAGIGFDAIAMALLGRSHPWGVVAAGVLFGALRAGGQQMQVSAEVGIDIIGVIQALIIVFIAAPALIRAIYRIKLGRATGLVKEVVLTE